jgi:hypothetical protein
MLASSSLTGRKGTFIGPRMRRIGTWIALLLMLGACEASNSSTGLPWQLYYCTKISRVCLLNSRFRFEEDCNSHKTFMTLSCPEVEGKPGHRVCTPEVRLMGYELVCSEGNVKYDAQMAELIEAADARRRAAQEKKR